MRIDPVAGEHLLFDCGLRSAGYVLNGILNGIDMSVWNPEEDTFIEHNYSLGNYSSGKAANKLALQKELGLPERDVRRCTNTDIGVLEALVNQLTCRRRGALGVFGVTGAVRATAGADDRLHREARLSEGRRPDSGGCALAPGTGCAAGLPRDG